jgi:hypothetical protein
LPMRRRFRLLEIKNTRRAGDRTRTGDVQLGKLAFYQLNYARRRGAKRPVASARSGCALATEKI